MDQGEGRLKSGGMVEAAVAIAVSGDDADLIEVIGAVNVVRLMLMETEIRGQISLPSA